MEFAIYAFVSVLLVAELAVFFALGFLTGKSKVVDPFVTGCAALIVFASGFAGVFLYVVKDDFSLVPMACIAGIWALGMAVGRVVRSKGK